MNVGFTKNDSQTLESLLNIGFNVDEIMNLPISEFEKFSGVDFELISKTNKYFRVTVDEKSKKRM